MWTQEQATRALRQVVAVAGAQPEEYALNSLKIRGVTNLSTGGAASAVLKREGRWASGGYGGYVGIHGKYAQWVSRVMVDRSECFKKRTGQGTRWGDILPTKLVRECERVDTRNAEERVGGVEQ